MHRHEAGRHSIEFTTAKGRAIILDFKKVHIVDTWPSSRLLLSPEVFHKTFGRLEWRPKRHSILIWERGPGGTPRVEDEIPYEPQEVTELNYTPILDADGTVLFDRGKL